jgi:hypothetical protein
MLGDYYSGLYKRSMFHGIPMSKYDEVRKTVKLSGAKVRYRFRGPRNTVLDRGRGAQAKQAGCLKANAVTFSIYKL